MWYKVWSLLRVVYFKKNILLIVIFFIVRVININIFLLLCKCGFIFM